MEEAAAARGGSAPQAAVAALVDDAIEVARDADRTDLVRRLAAARARVQRPGTVVVVVGEYKQGKSSLVNALVGREACPVDDDLATSVITVVHHAEAPTAVERRSTDDGVVVEEVPLADVRDHVTEAGNPGNERAIERLDLGVPSDVLADGLVLVDTPGMGGLGAGHTASTLGFLPYADALLFVTDASQELTRPEVDLLVRARDACPVVITCLTKIDLHPSWERIRELDLAHLGDAGVTSEVVPVSATVMRVARDRGDARLADESGVPDLASRLEQDVLDRARAVAAQQAATQVLTTIDQLEASTGSELAALHDPDRAAALVAEVEEARSRLAHLRGPGARWSTVLGDRITDLGQRVTHELRRAVRELSRGLEDEVADLSSDEDWQRLARSMQARTAEVVADLFAMVEHEGDALRADLGELLRAEAVTLPGTARPVAFDVTDMWRADQLDDTGLAERVGAGLSALRRAQSGVVMFGMMGRLLPAAATGLLASNPILLGAGVLLGGKALVDQRRRQVTERRHQARQALRQFLDDLQFELGPVLADAVRELHRTLRDGLGEAVGELQRTWSDVAERAQATLAASATERDDRGPVLEGRLEVLADLRRRATPVATAGAAQEDVT